MIHPVARSEDTDLVWVRGALKPELTALTAHQGSPNLYEFSLSFRTSALITQVPADGMLSPVN